MGREHNVTVDMVVPVVLPYFGRGFGPLGWIVSLDGNGNLSPSGSFLLFGEGDCDDHIVDSANKLAVVAVPFNKPSCKSEESEPIDGFDSFIRKVVAFVVTLLVVLSADALPDVFLSSVAFDFPEVMISGSSREYASPSNLPQITVVLQPPSFC